MNIQSVKWKRPVLAVALLAAGAVMSGPASASEVNLNMTRGTFLQTTTTPILTVLFTHRLQVIEWGPMRKEGLVIMEERLIFSVGST